MSEHLYPGKTVNFVLSAKVLSSLFSEHISELAQVNTTWTPEYANELQLRIDKIAGDYLGINNRNNLFTVTRELGALLVTITNDVVTLKKNVEADFKRTPEFNSIMSELGLNGTDIHKLTQPGLIALVTNLKRVLTPEFIARLTAKGMPSAIPQRIAGNAEALVNLNTEQEKLKGTTKEATGKMLAELNALYGDVIKICKLASDFYKNDATRKSMFTFSKIMKNLGEARTTAPVPKPAAN